MDRKLTGKIEAVTWHYRILKTKRGWGLFEIQYIGDKISSVTSNPEFGYFQKRGDVIHEVEAMAEGASHKSPRMPAWFKKLME